VNGLQRRLAALEQAPAAASVVWRIYSTAAEAEADIVPSQGVVVVQIITGVPRGPVRDAP
jgi:hypothetical protein